jgi:acyl carrier protein
MPRAFAILSIVLVLAMGVLGCSRSTKASPELLEKVRQQVAKTLRKDAAQLDVRKLLALQGARDIDIVVILIEVEDTFKVELPDSINQKTPLELTKTLTIQQLADAIAGQLEKQKR